MVCGIDVYHPGLEVGRRGSVAGFVASMDKLLTSWYSKICLQGAHQEIIDLLQICLISAINAFKKVMHICMMCVYIYCMHLVSNIKKKKTFLAIFNFYLDLFCIFSYIYYTLYYT